MSEILDVINKFTYQVEDAELKQAAETINRQVQGLTVLALRQQQLQQAFDRTAANEIEKRTRINGLIQRTKQSIDANTTAIGQQVQANAKLQNAIVKEIGLINTLDARLKVLQEDRKKAFDEKDIQRYNREIEATQKRIAQLTTTGKSGGGGILGSILQGVGIGTGIGLLNQVVGGIKSFVTESLELGRQAEGVERAFERLNKPDLLNNLRNATRNTVSDLELMKNAVQFNNFGLPVERLATALSFAERRAADTGLSVDYLVQSIVTGIGRQSPLILDNLGINAKRVADRFKETGDFAQAAFGIIQEEIEKSGVQLDTYAVKQAQLNALIANQQTQLGKELSKAGIVYDTIMAELVSALSGEFNNYTVATNELFEAQRRLEEKEKRDSLDNFKSYIETYEQVDAIGKKAIENQTRDSYNELIRQQQLFFNTGQESLAIALQGQIDQYVDFFSKLKGLGVKQPALSFSTFTQSDLSSLNKNDLTTLREQGNDALGLLTDPKEIERLKGRIGLIDKALERYSFTIKKVKKDTKDNKIKVRDLIAQTPEQWDAEITKIVDSLAKLRKPFSDTNNTQSGVVDVPVNTTGQNFDEIISQKNDIERAEKDRKEKDELAKSARELRVQQEKDAFKTIADAAIQSYGLILEAQINAADAEIAIRQSRVNAAIELAKNGNTEILELEQKRLEESIKEREKYAQRQAAINAALTISQSVLAIATAAGESGAGAIVIVPAVIAAIAAGFAAVTALSTESDTGFAGGGYTGDGGKHEKAGTVHKGEFVITKEQTAKNREVLEAIHSGAVLSAPMIAKYNNNYSNNTDMSGVVKELKSLKAVVADTQMKQDIFFNEYGVGIMTQRAIQTQQKVWS